MVKKVNAYVSLILTALLFVHVLYQTIAYLNYYHNPAVSKILGIILVIIILFHVAFSCISVFVFHDSKKVSYPKLNAKTLLQRISGFCILIMLIFHINTFSLMQKSAGTSAIITIIVIQVLFYFFTFLHIALSFSKAFVSLGLIQKRESLKKVDIIMAIVCVFLFIFASLAVSITQLAMFGG